MLANDDVAALARPFDPVVLGPAHPDEILRKVLRPLPGDPEEAGRLSEILHPDQEAGPRAEVTCPVFAESLGEYGKNRPHVIHRIVADDLAETLRRPVGALETRRHGWIEVGPLLIGGEAQALLGRQVAVVLEVVALEAGLAAGGLLASGAGWRSTPRSARRRWRCLRKSSSEGRSAPMPSGWTRTCIPRARRPDGWRGSGTARTPPHETGSRGRAWRDRA